MQKLHLGNCRKNLGKIVSALPKFSVCFGCNSRHKPKSFFENFFAENKQVFDPNPQLFKFARCQLISRV